MKGTECYRSKRKEQKIKNKKVCRENFKFQFPWLIFRINENIQKLKENCNLFFFLIFQGVLNADKLIKHIIKVVRLLPLKLDFEQIYRLLLRP